MLSFSLVRTRHWPDDLVHSLSHKLHNSSNRLILFVSLFYGCGSSSWKKWSHLAAFTVFSQTFQFKSNPKPWNYNILQLGLCFKLNLTVLQVKFLVEAQKGSRFVSELTVGYCRRVVNNQDFEDWICQGLKTCLVVTTVEGGTTGSSG